MTKTNILTLSKQVQTVEVKTYFVKLCSEKKNRKKKRQRSQDGDGDGGGNDTDSVPGQIPIDLLTKISPLCEKLGLSMRQQLSMAMGFAELCGKYKK